MAEDKHNKQSNREPIHFYSTFDGDIIQINDDPSQEASTSGGPRTSLPPVPVIPGNYTLSDAIVKARQRRNAEIARELEDQLDSADPTEEDGEPRLDPLEIENQSEETQQRQGDPLITAVSPGSFQRKGRRDLTRSLGSLQGETMLDQTLLAIFEEGAIKKKQYS